MVLIELSLVVSLHVFLESEDIFLEVLSQVNSSLIDISGREIGSSSTVSVVEVVSLHRSLSSLGRVRTLLLVKSGVQLSLSVLDVSLLLDRSHSGWGLGVLVVEVVSGFIFVCDEVTVAVAVRVGVGSVLEFSSRGHSFWSWSVRLSCFSGRLVVRCSGRSVGFPRVSFRIIVILDTSAFTLALGIIVLVLSLVLASSVFMVLVMRLLLSPSRPASVLELPSILMSSEYRALECWICVVFVPCSTDKLRADIPSVRA